MSARGRRRRRGAATAAASRPLSASSCSTGSTLVGAARRRRRRGRAPALRPGTARGARRRRGRAGFASARSIGERRRRASTSKRCLTVCSGIACSASVARAGAALSSPASSHDRRSVMFKALLLEKDDAGFRAGVATVDEAAPARRRRAGRGRALDAQLQGRRSRSPTRAPVVRSWPMVAGIDGAGTVLECSHPDWKAGDRVIHNGWGVGETRWGCLARAGAAEGRLAGHAAGGVLDAPGDGDRHRRLHRDAVRAGARAPRRARRATATCWSPARPAASAASRSRCSRRLGHRVVAATGKAARGRLPDASSARAEVIDRAELARAGQAAAEGALGRGGRRGRQPHAGQRAGADALRRRRRGLRAGAGHATCRARCCRSSCAASRWPASTA